MNTKKWIICLIIITIVVLFLVKILSSYQRNDYFSNKNNNKIYVFWTGGYDSTFRVCQALLDEGKVVQPIYISDIIDNLPQNSTRRKNRQFEYSAMKKIRERLNYRFPKTRKSFLKLIDIKKINVDNDISHHMKILKSQGRVRRAVCQYGAMSQVTKNMNKDIEICVENEPGSMLNKTMKGKLVCNGNICYLKDNLRGYDNSINIFKRFIFPTIKYTKKDMLDVAKRGGYEDILGMTWSCWYPINGKPCGRCIMCHERII